MVGVMTDKCVKEYKGKRPIMSFDERCEVVGAIRHVDCIVPQDTFEMTGNIKEYTPDIVFDSTNHDRKASYKYAKEQGCRVIKIPYLSAISSSKIKDRIKNEVVKGNSKKYSYSVGNSQWTNV